MKSSIENVGINKKLYAVIGIVFAVVYALCCFVISPLVAATVANVAYSNGVLPTALAYLDSLLTVIAISVAYAMIVLGKYNLGVKSFRGGSVIFVIATVVKYTANMLMSWISDQSIPRSWLWDVFDVVFYAVLECVQLLVFILIVNKLISNHSEREAAIKKANRALGRETEETSPYIFTKLYDKKNCLQKCAMIGALVVLISKVAGSLINDIWMIIIGGFPSEPVTAILMLANYLSSVIFGVICYFAMNIAIVTASQKYIS